MQFLSKKMEKRHNDDVQRGLVSVPTPAWASLEKERPAFLQNPGEKLDITVCTGAHNDI